MSSSKYTPMETMAMVGRRRHSHAHDHFLHVCPVTLEQTYIGLEVELEYEEQGGRQALHRALGSRASQHQLSEIVEEIYGQTLAPTASPEYPNLWSIHSDGSLRHSEGIRANELVLSSPIQLEQVDLALAALSGWMEHGVESVRHGVHVHVNAIPLTPWDVGVGLLTYAIFEPSIFELVGGGRRESIFCVPLEETITCGRNAMRRLAESVFDPVRLHGVTEGWSRYTALNLYPLTTHGTVEFRHMPTPLENSARRIASFAEHCASIFAPSRYLPSRFFKSGETRFSPPSVVVPKSVLTEQRLILSHMFDAALLRAKSLTRGMSTTPISPHLTTPWGRAHAVSRRVMKSGANDDGRSIDFYPDDYWMQSTENRNSGHTSPMPGDEIGAYDDAAEDNIVWSLTEDDFESLADGGEDLLAYHRHIDCARTTYTQQVRDPFTTLSITDEGIALASSLIPTL
jgi:hypothetical protein